MGTRGYCWNSSHGEPAAGDGGRTGSWRVLRPVMDQEKCIPSKKGKPACFICWLFCPEGVISRTVPPSIDYEYCKGCGICARECPSGAIVMVEESSFINEGK